MYIYRMRAHYEHLSTCTIYSTYPKVAHPAPRCAPIAQELSVSPLIQTWTKYNSPLRWGASISSRVGEQSLRGRPAARRKGAFEHRRASAAAAVARRSRATTAKGALKGATGCISKLTLRSSHELKVITGAPVTPQRQALLDLCTAIEPLHCNHHVVFIVPHPTTCASHSSAACEGTDDLASRDGATSAFSHVLSAPSVSTSLEARWTAAAWHAAFDASRS
jgi:hypothetical protein